MSVGVVNLLSLWAVIGVLQTGLQLKGSLLDVAAPIVVDGPPCHCHCEVAGEECPVTRPAEPAAAPSASGPWWTAALVLFAEAAAIALALVGAVARRLLSCALAPPPLQPRLEAPRAELADRTDRKKKSVPSASSGSSGRGALAHLAVDASEL